MRTVKFEDVPNLPEIYEIFTQEMAERVIGFTRKEDLPNYDATGMEAQCNLIRQMVGNKISEACKNLCGDSDFYWEYMQHLLVACYPGEFRMQY
jgi:hypothetical protein